MLGGVASGVANYFDIDPTIIRLVWFVTVFWGGLGFWLYIVAWIVVPPNPDGPSSSGFERTEHWRESVMDTARDVEQRFRQGEGQNEGEPRRAGSGSTSGSTYPLSGVSGSNPRQVLGWILVILGIVFILQKLIPWGWMFIRPLWPIALILLGLVLILREVRR